MVWRPCTWNHGVTCYQNNFALLTRDLIRLSPIITTVTAWACNSDAFGQKCSRMLESYGWKLLGIDCANPVSEDDEFTEEAADMLERTKSNRNAIFIRNISYPKM